MRFSPECAFAIGAGGKAVPLANIEEEADDEEYGACGFTVSECDELLQQGGDQRHNGYLFGNICYYYYFPYSCIIYSFKLFIHLF